MKTRHCKNCGSDIKGILTTTCPNCHQPLRLSAIQTAAVFFVSGLTLIIGIVLLSTIATPNQTHQAQVQGASTKKQPTATPTPTSIPSNAPTPTVTLSPSPTPIPTSIPPHKATIYIVPTQTTVQPTQATTTQSQGLSNNKYYTNSSGNEVHSPAYSKNGSVPAGATAKCVDGIYSFSQHRSGTCSGHGGVAQWY